jgi:hypothetical protein
VDKNYSASTSRRVASRKLARSLAYLHSAERQMASASQAEPNRYHQDRLRFITDGLSELSIPLTRIVSRLERER